ncbi:hypothetical protein LINPERPRIM_LOCUS3618 [Linum perenne]
MGSAGENVVVAAGGETTLLIESKEWYMAAYSTHGIPTSDHLKLHRVTIPAEDVPSGHILVQTLWISVDPYFRSMMTGPMTASTCLSLSLMRFYGSMNLDLMINLVVKTCGAAKVIRSEHEDYKAGDIFVNPFRPIADYTVISPNRAMKKLDLSSQVSPLEHLNSLGT